MINRLGIRQSSLIRNVSSPNSPALESPEEGLVLNVSGLGLESGCPVFTLHLTGRFNATFFSGYQTIHFAPVILFQDTMGRAATIRPIDTHKRYIPKPGPNWKDPGRAPTRAFRRFWIEMPLKVEEGILRGKASIFVTAMLQNNVSNTLALDPKTGICTSYKEGKPHVIRLDAAAAHG
jgi:hypothetical protein